MHLTSSPIDWYAIRASGVLAYLLLTAVVVFGVGLAGRVRLERWPRFSVEELHRFLGLVTGVFVGIHVLTTAIDSFIGFSLADLVVPFAGTYRPLWMGLGIVATELLLALAISNRLRGRLGHRVWRSLHYLNFVVWIAATLHGIGTGTDSTAPWMLALYAIGVAAVSAASAARVLGRRGRTAPVLLASGAVAAAAGVAVVVALGVSVPPATGGGTRVATAVPLTESFSGTIVNETGVTRQLTSVVAHARGKRQLLLRIDLLAADQSVTDTSLQLEYLPDGVRCTGTVSAIDSSGFQGTCSLADGGTRSVRATWSVESGTRVDGQLEVRA